MSELAERRITVTTTPTTTATAPPEIATHAPADMPSESSVVRSVIGGAGASLSVATTASGRAESGAVSEPSYRMTAPPGPTTST